MTKKSRDRRVMCRWIERSIREKMREEMRSYFASLPKESEEPAGIWHPKLRYPKNAVRLRHTFDLAEKGHEMTIRF